MNCESCQQNEATVHLTEIQNHGAKKELHLCEACAEKKGVSMLGEPTPVAEALGELMHPPVGADLKDLLDQRCPTCGITYPEFRTRGRLGCTHDYQVFQRGLEPLLEKIHGFTHHVGKVPSTAGQSAVHERALRRLRQDLQKAIKMEAYEQAAQLRDQIADLERDSWKEVDGD